jgi:hypothetical protein
VFHFSTRIWFVLFLMTFLLDWSREELPSALVQPAGPAHQPARLLGGGGGAAAGGAPRLRQQVGPHRAPLPRPHRQRRQEPLARPHGAPAARAVRPAPPPQSSILVVGDPPTTVTLRAPRRRPPTTPLRLAAAAVQRAPRRAPGDGGHPRLQGRELRVRVNLHHGPLARIRWRPGPLLPPETEYVRFPSRRRCVLCSVIASSLTWPLARLFAPQAATRSRVPPRHRLSRSLPCRRRQRPKTAATGWPCPSSTSSASAQHDGTLGGRVQFSILGGGRDFG